MADNNAGLALAVLGLSKSGGGSGPSEYIKSAKVEDGKLILTKNDGTTIEFGYEDGNEETY